MKNEPLRVIYSEEGLTFGEADGKHYLVTGGKTYRISGNIYEPSLFIEFPDNRMVTLHNSFTVDEEGNDLLVFHARPYRGFKGDALSDPNRHCFLRTVRYDADNCPLFSEELNTEQSNEE